MNYSTEWAHFFCFHTMTLGIRVNEQVACLKPSCLVVLHLCHQKLWMPAWIVIAWSIWPDPNGNLLWIVGWGCVDNLESSCNLLMQELNAPEHNVKSTSLLQRDASSLSLCFQTHFTKNTGDESKSTSCWFEFGSQNHWHTIWPSSCPQGKPSRECSPVTLGKSTSRTAAKWWPSQQNHSPKKWLQHGKLCFEVSSILCQFWIWSDTDRTWMMRKTFKRILSLVLIPRFAGPMLIVWANLYRIHPTLLSRRYSMIFRLSSLFGIKQHHSMGPWTSNAPIQMTIFKLSIRNRTKKWTCSYDLWPSKMPNERRFVCYRLYSASPLLRKTKALAIVCFTPNCAVSLILQILFNSVYWEYVHLCKY